MIRTVCVYCGSNRPANPLLAQAARTFGEVLADRGYALVYGGVGLGMMGQVADGALARGGRVTGIIPEPLLAREIAHPHLSERIVVADMHARKKLMAERAGAFVVLPGGCGTFDEFFEIFTWAQIELHAKPIALLNVEHYFDPLIALLGHMVTNGFLKRGHRDMLIVESDPGEILSRLEAYVAPHLNKWNGALA
ncbi:MAG TPA: TIGR00730 family Rossman fold protein [Usitatibacteraceae bacterium]|nr:TIGR00730 family Rossman fold protein [Usitatibacteraceae bacterium]